MEDALTSPVNGKVTNLIPPNSEFLCDCKVLTEKESIKTLPSTSWENIVPPCGCADFLRGSAAVRAACPDIDTIAGDCGRLWRGDARGRERGAAQLG